LAKKGGIHVIKKTNPESRGPSTEDKEEGNHLKEGEEKGQGTTYRQ